jgi:hypothetical protein
MRHQDSSLFRREKQYALIVNTVQPDGACSLKIDCVVMPPRSDDYALVQIVVGLEANFSLARCACLFQYRIEPSMSFGIFGAYPLTKSLIFFISRGEVPINFGAIRKIVRNGAVNLFES